MRSKIKILVIIFAISLFFSKTLFAQNVSSTDIGIESVIEAIAERVDADLDYSELVERLLEISKDPININQASEDDLQHLVFLTDFQIFNLVKYRKRVGQIHTIYELQYVYGFDTDLVKLLMPFIVLDESAKKSIGLGKALKYGRNDVILRYERVLEEQKGYISIPEAELLDDPDKSRFLGTPDKYYLKYKFHYKEKLSFGITAEKDPGEEFFNGAQKYGFDYYSGHFQVRDVGVFKTINLGDYSVQFGQGLVAWSSMSFGKSPYVMNVARKGRGIYKYSSANENQFLRGVATTVKLGAFEASGFFSYKPIDANIDLTDTLDNVQTVSSFQNVGYHRTPSEVADRHAINEMITGGNLKYSYNNFRLGMTYAWYHYDADLNIPDDLYRLFDFEGNSFSNLGLDYRWQVQKISLFGEFAVNDALRPALVTGVSASIAPQMAVSLVYRNLDPGYYAGYASAFGERSGVDNENGLFLGTEISPFPGWKLKGYFDMFHFPWIAFQTSSPSGGYDWLVQLDYNMNRYVKMFWRVKGQEKDASSSSDVADISYMLPEQSIKARYTLEINPDAIIKLKTQVEYSGFKETLDSPTENGYLLSQDFIWQVQRFPLRLSTRFAIFRTDSYDARIYAYEYDVLYAFSIPAYYYHGKRAYLLAMYSPTENLDLWFRISRTYYDNKDVISSGLTEINASHKTGVKFQIRYKF